MLFWILLFCHLVADYPLQTEAMVKAKKTFSGLLIHVSIHFLIMMAVLSALGYDFYVSFSLSFAVSLSHLAIDHWKNSLSKIRPQWVIFTYVQDQILHLISIVLISLLFINFTSLAILPSNYPPYINVINFIYASFFVISTHVWFVSEKVFSYQQTAYQQKVIMAMWSRMMSRLLFYFALFFSWNIGSIILIISGILVVWYDLDKKSRDYFIAMDLIGMILLSFLACNISSNQFF